MKKKECQGRCPVCDSIDVTLKANEYDEVLSVTWTCNECGEDYTEYYTYCETEYDK